jgi:hypothetical protein
MDNHGILFYKKELSQEVSKELSKVIVVSRYNENLEWLKEFPFNLYPVIIYNKGTNDEFYKPDKLIKIVNIENVGRCDHTYLYHIVHNYHQLHDIIVFLPGSTNAEYRFVRCKHLILYIQQFNKAVFLCSEANIDSLYDFQLDQWQASSVENNSVNPENKLKQANIRPFGKWFNAMFGNIKVNYISWNGLFSMSKLDILHHPKSYYERLILEVSDSSNPEAGHYFERSWEAVFHPMKNTMKIAGY